MRGCGIFLLLIAALAAVVSLGMAWPFYLAFAAVGCLLLIAAGPRRPRYRPRRRVRYRR